jgi:peroxiredoxin family protein
VQSLIPTYEAFATKMMKKTIKKSGVADLGELRSLCIEAGVNLIACQMTVDLFGYKHEDFIPEVKDYVGAATFLPMAKDADVSLFI